MGITPTAWVIIVLMAIAFIFLAKNKASRERLAAFIGGTGGSPPVAKQRIVIAGTPRSNFLLTIGCLAAGLIALLFVSSFIDHHMELNILRHLVH